MLWQAGLIANVKLHFFYQCNNFILETHLFSLKYSLYPHFARLLQSPFALLQ